MIGSRHQDGIALVVVYELKQRCDHSSEFSVFGAVAPFGC